MSANIDTDLHDLAMYPTDEALATDGYQDEDGDGTMNRMITSFPAMPKEPYDISNNVWAGFSKAGFQDALIDVVPPLTEINIELSSHLRKLFN